MGKVQLEAVLKLVDVQINPQVFQKISQSVAGMPPALGKSSDALKKTGVHADTLNKKLRGTKEVINANERAARLFLRRMAQFAILLPTFATLNRAIQGGVKFLFDFDSALRDIVRIDIGNLKDRMEEVGDAALATAVKYGVTGTEVLRATRIFKQAGFTIEESQAKAEAAILATQISTLTSAQATEVFIAAQKQFGAEGQNSISVLDKLAKVEDLAAVNASDVADAFRTGGNALAEFSKSIDDSVGIIAALREQSRKSGREIGTFLKTIQTRMFAAGEARSSLESLGVTVENLDGSLRPTLSVLDDLKDKFDGLTQAQRTNAAKSIAGIRQFESLLAVLNSLERANELSAASSRAAGTADEKRVITDAKLERQVGKLIAQGQAFAEAMGDAGLEDTLASALKMAERLLLVFTSFSNVLSDIGGSIVPLLALSGITLGRSVFGLGGGGKPGGKPGDATKGNVQKPGLDKNFIGPLNKTQSQIASFGTQMKRAGSIVADSTKITAMRVAQGRQLVTIGSTEITGVKARAAAHKQLTAAIKQNISAIKASSAARTAQGGGLKGALGGAAGTALFTLGGATIPALFESIAKRLRSFDNNIANLGAETLDASSSTLSMAAQFAVLGGKASAIAGAVGAVSNAMPKILNAIDDEFVARKELKNTIKNQQKEEGIAAKLGSRSQAGTAVASKLFGSFSAAAERAGTEGGQALHRELQAAFEEIGKDFGTTGQDFAKTFLTPVTNELGGIVDSNAIGIDTLKQLKTEISDASGLTGIDIAIVAHKELLKSIAEENGTLKEYDRLIKGVSDGTLRSNESLSSMLDVLGKGTIKFNEFTLGATSVNKSLSELGKISKLQGAIDSFRTLGLELDLAKLGPEALADSVVRMQQELLLSEREFGNTSKRLGKDIDDLTGHISELGIFSKGAELFQAAQEGLDSMDSSEIAAFNQFMKEQPPAVRETIAELLKLREQQRQAELDFQNQQNALQGEMIARRKAMFETEAQAAQNAFESTRRFSAELEKFGDAVTTDVLSQFQNIGLGDVEDVLAGTSDLSGALQQMIINAFDPISQAEQDLANVTATTQAELDILAKRLGIVTQKLSDEANAANAASLTAQKHAITLDIEKTIQSGAISATEAKIKILESEKDAAEDAAEAEKKRFELLEKLAEASRDFENELRDVRDGFEEFSKDKIADLLKKETDVRSELKDAQKDVLSSTTELADAYNALGKAQLEFNGAIAEAQLKSNLLARDIATLTGGLVTFQSKLSSLNNAYRDVLGNSNITLQKRIELERQLADETLAFLQQASSEITQAGIGIFGQSSQENQALGQGIAGLQHVADQLGGSFEGFLNMSSGDFSAVSETLLGLPTEFRQQMLSALSSLPSTMNIGGFNVDQLTQALGQVGAGVAPDAGLPSIEELNGQQVEQLTKLQELALQDAQLQFSQVIAAQQQVAAAQEAADAAQILQERAKENLVAVRDAVLEEKAVLDFANEQRNELLNAVIAADDKNTLLMIEREAQAFADQNAAFSKIGDNIVTGIASAIGSRLAVLNVAAQSKGYIPNFSSGNLSPGEAAGVLRAASREKRAMPPGAGLAVANTSEAIIPMRSTGFIPNFQKGNVSGDSNTSELLAEVVRQLNELNDTSDVISSSNTQIQSNTTGDAKDGAAGGSQDVTITLQTNQNNTVSITGLESLREEIATVVRGAATEQVDKQLEALLEELDSVIVALQERGLLSSFGQPR
jgi:TP901 family phage tail tape measure protein